MARGEKPNSIKTEGQTLESLAFFYIPDRDWIVLNKNHALYEFYSKIIQIYLKMSETSRREIVATAPTDTVKAAFEILNDVINYRAFVYGNGVPTPELGGIRY